MNGMMGLFANQGQGMGGMGQSFTSDPQRMTQALQAIGQSGLPGTNMLPMVMALRNSGFKNKYGVPMQQMGAPVSTASPVDVPQSY